jgi:hypothetical protein
MRVNVNGEVLSVGKTAAVGKVRPVAVDPAAAKTANKARPGPQIPLPAGAARPPGDGLNLKQIIHSLNLPQDNLSATLINLARNFSLPLDPALLSRLRREALTLKARHTGSGVSPETAALAATAAAGKGVLLGEEALEQYARAIDPDYAADEQDSPPFEHGEGQSSGGEGDAGHSASREQRDPVNVEREIRKIPGEAEPGLSGEESPLLSLLNRLPGREGNFWAVYPFKINLENLKIRVSVWILLPCKDYNKDCKDSTKEELAGRSSAESIRGIAVNAVGEKRRWVFNILNPGGPEAKTRVSVSPPYGEPVRKKVEREIRGILGDFGGEVTLNAASLVWDQDSGSGGAFFFTGDPAGLSRAKGFFPPVEEEA